MGYKHILLSYFLLFIMLSFSVYAIDFSGTRKNVTVVTDQGAAVLTAPPQSDVATGGNVTELDLSSTSTTVRWQGFFGDLSSSLQLGKGSSVLYTFAAPSSLAGVYIAATTGEQFNFATMGRGNISGLDVGLGWNGLTTGERVVNAFVGASNSSGDGNGGGPGGNVSTAQNITVNVSYTFNISGVNVSFLRSGDAGTHFPNGAVTDGGSNETQASWAIVTAVNTSMATAFDTTAAIEYELMVPVDDSGGNPGTATYFFFISFP